MKLCKQIHDISENKRKQCRQTAAIGQEEELTKKKKKRERVKK